MEHLIQTLLTMTATASVVAVCVMVLRLPLKRAPRWITCCLWLVVFLRMVCPTGLSLPVSLVPQSVSNGSYVEDILPAAPQTAPEEPLPTVPAQETGVSTPAAPVTQMETPDTSAPLWPVALTVVWAAGTAAALLWAVVSYGRLRRRIADAVLVEGNLYETDQIDTPFVCGFFRPRIYLPVGLQAADRQYVLLHEQAHLRRRDYRIKPLAYLALCVHWFNPVLWLAYRLFCRDVETACDQAVIRSLDRDATAQYAAALLHLGRKTTLPSAVPLAFGEEDAKGRVRSVLSYRKPAFWSVLVAVVVCVAAAVLLLGNSNQQMEGHKISDAHFLSFGDSAAVPKNLQRELLALYIQYEDDKTAAPDVEPLSNVPSIALCTNPEKATVYSYYLLEENEQIYLMARKQVDGFIRDTQTYQMPEDFYAPYHAWQKKLEDYLWVTRPDELFASQRREIQNENDVSALLSQLDFAVVTGGYSLQLDRSSTPYHLTIVLEQPPVLLHEKELLTAYLSHVETMLFTLTSNLDGITWTNGTNHQNGGFYPTVTAPGIDDPAAFRAVYKQFKESGGAYMVAVNKGFTATRQVLYLSPQLAERVTEATVLNGHYEISCFHFTPTPAMGTDVEKTYPDPYYRHSQDLTPANDFLAAYGVDPAQHLGQAICTVIQNVYTQDTGYRIYEWDGDVFLAHFDLTGGGETLEYLVQLET